MGVESALINEKISSELGEEGLRGLLACLWPVDCQTCGGFLGEEPPSLCVDDSVIFAVASLHHPGCRTPVWNDSGMITAVSDISALSYVTTALLLPLGHNGREEWWPMMVVNPGLESVVLEREDQGWRVRPNLAFKAAGLVPPGPGLMIGRPVDGAVALITATSVAVAFQVTPLRTYEAPVDEAIAECARTRGGVLIGVTHALNPGELTEEDLNTAMATGQILMGWAGVHGAAPRLQAQLSAARRHLRAALEREPHLCRHAPGQDPEAPEQQEGTGLGGAPDRREERDAAAVGAGRQGQVRRRVVHHGRAVGQPVLPAPPSRRVDAGPGVLTGKRDKRRQRQRGQGMGRRRPAAPHRGVRRDLGTGADHAGVFHAVRAGMSTAEARRPRQHAPGRRRIRPPGEVTGGS